MEFSLLQGIGVGVAVALTLTLKALRVRVASLRAHKGRHDSLRKLLGKVGNERWRSASALELQLAVEEAYSRRAPDDRDIRFMLDCHNPDRLIRDRLMADNFVRLSQNGAGFEDARGFQIFRYRHWATAVEILGYPLTFVSGLFAVAALQTHSDLAFVLGVDAVTAFLVTVFGSFKLRAAARLLDVRPERVIQPQPPLLPSEPPQTLEEPTTHKKSKLLAKANGSSSGRNGGRRKVRHTSTEP